jgi:protein TonB
MSTVAVADITVVIKPSVPVPASSDQVRWSVPAGQTRTPPANFAGRVFQLSELDRRPVLVSSVEPVFPTELTTASVEGIVVIHFIVSARGVIEDPVVVSTPHPLLGAAVTKALAHWQFRAGMKNGRAVSTEMELPVRFNLSGT